MRRIDNLSFARWALRGGSALPPTVDPVVNREEGLTLTASFAPYLDIASADMGPNTSTVFAVDFTDLDGSSGGIIFQVRGGSTGAYVGFRADGRFIARAGNGASAAVEWNSNTSYIEVPSANAPRGTGTLVWSFRAGTVYTRAWWNGVLLGPTVNTGTGAWGGSNAGSFLRQGGNNAPAGEYIATAPLFTTASNMRFYDGQTVVD